MLEIRKPASTGLVVTAVACTPFGTWWMGYALSTLWRWFAVPLGLPVIGIATMLGLSCIVYVARYDMLAAIERPDSTWGAKQYFNYVLYMTIIPGAGLAFGRLYLYLSTF